MIASSSGGSTCMWSLIQSDSKPWSSPHRATSTVRRQAVAGSTPRYSRSQPWGRLSPSFIASPPVGGRSPRSVRPGTERAIDDLADPGDLRVPDGPGVGHREPQVDLADVAAERPERLRDVVPGDSHRLRPDIDPGPGDRPGHRLRFVVLDHGP